MDLPLLMFAVAVAVFTGVQAIRRWSDLYIRMMMLGVTCAMFMIVALELASANYLRSVLRPLAGIFAMAGIALLVFANHYAKKLR